MLNVGFIDDDPSLFGDYKRRFHRHSVELILYDGPTVTNAIADWAVTSGIECLIVDHQLSGKYSFTGTKFVSYLNDLIPDLPCFILTSYPEESINSNLVALPLILDRAEVSGEDITKVVTTIKQAVEVYRNRTELHVQEFASLNIRRSQTSFTATEEERMIELYRRLRGQGLVDEFPSDVLRPIVSQQIDNLIGKIDDLLQQGNDHRS